MAGNDEDVKLDQADPAEPGPAEHRRRPRYSGTHPVRYEEKYKEHGPAADRAILDKVMASGKTPAGMHRSIMVAEVLEALRPRPGETVVDATLGWGGHTREIIPHLAPGGRVIGLDSDPLELPKTVDRLRAEGFGTDVFIAVRSNFSGLPGVLKGLGLTGVDCILADLGVSSMQIDNPARGFSVKFDGPLDMRMNPDRGITAAAWLAKVSREKLEKALAEDADEPEAGLIAQALAGRSFERTMELAGAVRGIVKVRNRDEADLAVRRVFQTLRIEINEELRALDSFLRVLPDCLNPGGRVAIMSFHSGEDRRVKKSFKAGLAEGVYAEIADEVIRAGVTERRDNPRSSPAKLRWAVRSAIIP